jgi:hypothetical protein
MQDRGQAIKASPEIQERMDEGIAWQASTAFRDFIPLSSWGQCSETYAPKIRTMSDNMQGRHRDIPARI